MTTPAATTAHADDHAPGHDEHIHSVSHYVKIWAILCVLLAISFLGPYVGIKAVTIMTAFGIAIVKAFMVCAYFMHLNIEKKLGAMIVCVALIIMGLFFAGVSPDVMKHEGDHWTNYAANAETTRRIEREGEHGEKLDEKLKAAEESEKPEKK